MQGLVIESVRLAAAKALYDPVGLQQVFQARMRECKILTQRTEPLPDMWPNILVSTFAAPSLLLLLHQAWHPHYCCFHICDFTFTFAFTSAILPPILLSYLGFCLHYFCILVSKTAVFVSSFHLCCCCIHM